MKTYEIKGKLPPKITAEEKKPAYKRQCKVCEKWFEGDGGYALIAYRILECCPSESFYICDDCLTDLKERRL